MTAIETRKAKLGHPGRVDLPALPLADSDEQGHRVSLKAPSHERQCTH